MIDWHLFGAFLAAAVLLVILPGPDMILIVASGSRHGPRAGVAAAAGIAAGLTVRMVITMAGWPPYCTAFLRRIRLCGGLGPDICST